MSQRGQEVQQDQEVQEVQKGQGLFDLAVTSVTFQYFLLDFGEPLVRLDLAVLDLAGTYWQLMEHT